MKHSTHLVAALLMTVACSGKLGESSSDGAAGAGIDPALAGGAPMGANADGAGPAGQPLDADATDTEGRNIYAVGPRPLTRLTRLEYNNTVRDLLHDDSRPADSFPEDTSREFLFARSELVAAQDADVLRAAAETLAARAVGRLDELLPCSPDAGEDACASEFIATFGRRAYRRPPTAGEVTRLRALYDKGRSELQLDFDGAMGLLIEAMLQSPAFLYHWGSPEQVPALEAGMARLGPYELASRLSYFLWASMPDDTLLDAAAGGGLQTEEDVAAQARRMLQDEKAKGGVGAFFEGWLELNHLPETPKDTEVYPQYDSALAEAMAEETRRFVEHVMFDADARLDTLFTADFSFVNESLADVYDMNASGDELTLVQLDTQQRTGILTQGSFLALTGATDGSHPIRRGYAIFEKFMCKELPPPPNEVPPADPPEAGGTTRERAERHAEQPCAKACHTLFDPIGFAFENYDGIGQYRTTDNGGMVDSSGEVLVDGDPKPFTDAISLSAILAQSSEVKTCFARQWLRYGLRRHETPADEISLEHALTNFNQAQSDVRELVVGVATSRAFRYRQPAEGEVLQ